LRLWLALACALVPLGASARVAVVGRSSIPVFRTAMESARAAGPDALYYDLAELSSEVVARRLGVSNATAVVAVGPEALAVTARTRLPTVFLMVADPEPVVSEAQNELLIGIDLVVSPESTLEMLRRLAPSVRRLWTLFTPEGSGAWVERFSEAARERGLQVTFEPAADAASAVRRLLDPPEGVQAYVMFPDRVVRTSATDKALWQLAFKRRLLVIGVSSSDVRAGALFALQLNAAALGQQAMRIANEAGADPKAFPRRWRVPPEGSQLVLNLSTARFLGLTIPPEVLASAVEVVGE
jgi:putative ABC transport system substrate-binding protein